MSTNIELGQGFCLALGGTNAREASVGNGDLTGYQSVATPHSTDDFFGWMANRILNASQSGAEWTVAGFPGPVSKQGNQTYIGPMANIPGLADKMYDLEAALGQADP